MTGCHAARLRCPVCGNPDWHAREIGEECTHCGLCLDDAAAAHEASVAIPARLSDGYAAGRDGDRWRLSREGWRNAAWRHGYAVRDGVTSLAVPASPDLTFAIMTRPIEAGAAAVLMTTLGKIGSTLAIIDAEDPAPWCGMFAGTELLAHPLAGDFAAQRNRLQAAAKTRWVLQLDSDECLDPALLANLGWVAAAADRDGLRSLGIPRRNLVDGVQSALFPDIQYRLNRSDIRFAGVVHERPVVAFAETSLMLCGAIEHRLARAHVIARTSVYAGLSSEGARPEDEARLLRRFDPIADR